MDTKRECQLLVARQIAQSQGLNWTLIQQTKRAVQLLTLAASILATVERKASVRWLTKESADGRER